MDCRGLGRPQRGFGVGLAALKAECYSFSSNTALGTRPPGTGTNDIRATVEGGGGQAWLWFGFLDMEVSGDFVWSPTFQERGNMKDF